LHAQGRRFDGYTPLDRQDLLAFAREVSSVALSHFQQSATSEGGFDAAEKACCSIGGGSTAVVRSAAPLLITELVFVLALDFGLHGCGRPSSLFALYHA
jgi:hypothetical protein